MRLPLPHVQDHVTKESLPLPYVHYPSLYGTFIAFSGDDRVPYLCECARGAIENYIKFSLLRTCSGAIDDEDDDISAWNPDMLLISSRDFPLSVSKLSIKGIRHQDAHIINNLRFRPYICHKCNFASPLLC